MAKKKETDLTPEERLQVALVSEWEQPYKVPENWCWVRLGTICSLENGNKHKDEELVYFDVKTLRSVTNPQKRSSGIVVNKNKKVILVDGENSGEVFIVPYRGYMGSTFRIINISNYANEIYIRYFIGHNQNRLKKSKVGSAIPHLNKELFFGLELPFPPLKEQQRIVDRVEILFAKLDAAKQKAQDALDSFEIRKAAILHKAFTGNLTAQWRKEHGVGMESWEMRTSTQLFEYVTSGSRGWAKYYADSGDIFIRMGNLDHGTIELDLSDIKYVKLPNQIEGQRTRLQKNDILISITADIGKVGIVCEIATNAYINQHIALARPTVKDNAEFLAWYLVSDVGLQQLQKKQHGAIKVGLGLDDIRSLELLVPTKEEQTEIIRILDNLLSKEKQAKEAAEAVVVQIDLIKKSILAQAFHGELGTNEPSEESSIELLKRSFLEKIETEKVKPKHDTKPPKEVIFVPKTIMEVLSKGVSITPENLKSETELPIDDFYAQLKELIDNGSVIESRENGESYLEAANENR